MTTNLKPDEELSLFPVVAERTPEGWSVQMHAWVYEPEETSLRRVAAVKLLCASLGLADDDARNEVFGRRARAFLVDNERRKTIVVKLGGHEYVLTETGADGHCRTTLRLPADALSAAPAPATTVLREGDTRHFGGFVYPLALEGVSVVSDIDDTIKITEVRNRKAMARNTFLREFAAVPGIAQAYAHWANLGASFHYVSASPWQLYPALADFFTAAGFPGGSVHLKQFRWKDSSFFSLLQDPVAYKAPIIRALLAAAPHRSFVFVGDSGEKDPEIYGGIFRESPTQVRHIYIRDITGDTRTDTRYRETFENVPAGRWTLFTDSAALPAAL